MVLRGNLHDVSHTNEAFLSQLKCEAAGDFLQFVVAVFTWVDFNSSFGSAEWNINASAFECHQGRQGLNFINVNLIGITDT